MKRPADARSSGDGRQPGNTFEVLLEQWQRGEDVSWGDLFAAWVKAPLAPRSPDVVLRVIRKVEWLA